MSITYDSHHFEPPFPTPLLRHWPFLLFLLLLLFDPYVMRRDAM
jgi:hypothetical protein